MIEKVYSLFQKLRGLYFPHRIQKYGLVGLSIYDDRTKLEKIIDAIDEKLLNLKLYEINIRQRQRGFKRYFDWSLGTWIDSTNKIKNLEKATGLTYSNIREWEKYKSLALKERDRMFEKKLSKDISEVVKEVKQGRSFIKESINTRRKIFDKYGKH
jgi:predicted DNA-binding protein YlxM (UPF0122 family)